METEINRRIREARERRGQTYHGQTQGIDDYGGRFARVSKTMITGSEPVVRYPALPSGNPWSKDILGTEPSLGYSVEAKETTGEVHEVEASREAKPVRFVRRF